AALLPGHRALGPEPRRPRQPPPRRLGAARAPAAGAAERRRLRRRPRCAGPRARAREPRGFWPEHVCASARIAGERAAITLVPRLLARRGAEALPLGAEYW